MTPTLPITVRGVRHKAGASIKVLFVFADTAKINKGSLAYDDFCFEEGHGEVSYVWYKLYTFRLDDYTAKRHLARMQQYYDSIQDDQPVKLKLAKKLQPKPEETTYENISSAIHYSSY